MRSEPQPKKIILMPEGVDEKTLSDRGAQWWLNYASASVIASARAFTSTFTATAAARNPRLRRLGRLARVHIPRLVVLARIASLNAIVDVHKFETVPSDSLYRLTRCSACRRSS